MLRQLGVEKILQQILLFGVGTNRFNSIPEIQNHFHNIPVIFFLYILNLPLHWGIRLFGNPFYIYLLSVK